MQNLRCPKCGEPVARGGMTRGVQRYIHKRSYRATCGWNGTRPVGIEKAESEGVDRAAADALHRKVRGLRVARYVITAAQNATPVNKRFLASLLGYCKARRAQLIVIPYRYKNPTSRWSAAAEHDDWWAPELAGYLLDKRVDLNPNLILLADIKTQPTATGPLLGFETVTGAKSAIIGHPKLQLKTVATPQSKMAKILTTTGAVTERNYIPSKAGKKAEHHHSFAASVVEVVGKTFHLRQINAVTDGSFIDLEHEYDGAIVRKAPPLAALVMGDSHIEFIDPQVVKATFDGKDSIIGVLKPEILVWHDAWDAYARNHHHRGEVFINYVKHNTGQDNIEKSLDETFSFIDRKTPPGVRNVFIPSNHPDGLAKWVKDTDPRTDPENCLFWAETFRAMCLGSTWTDTGARTIDPFAYWGMKKLKSAGRTNFLRRGQSFTVKGIELTYHGDAGSNGARPSLTSYARIGVKTVTGHGHAPGIEDGAYRTGTSSRIPLEYSGAGPSSWMHSHCAIYGNGKRTLIHIVNGEWRAR